MGRFRFRRRGRINFGRTRKIVRAVTGVVLSKRILVNKLTIPDITSADYDNPVRWDLVQCSEAIAEEVESTGGTTAASDVATVPVYSRLLKLRMSAFVQGGGGEIVRWMLVKNKDGDQSTANYMTNFHTSDDSATAREIRGQILAKGVLVVANDKLSSPLRIFVSRAAWKRASPMHENDILSMILAKDATGTTCGLTCFGTIWVKANG